MSAPRYWRFNALRLNVPAMAKDTITTAPTPTTTTDRKGLLPAAVHMALDVADRGQNTALAALQDARVEVRTAVDHGIEFAEKLAAGAFRFTRKLVQRVDDASTEMLGNVEKLLAGAIKSARDTTRAAQELATTATAGVTGPHAQA
jgi:hypothetical protein